MCTTCGVTDKQYDDARQVAHTCCMVSLCEHEGTETASYGYVRPSAEVVNAANDHIQRYHAAHPGQGLTREEMVAALGEHGWQG